MTSRLILSQFKRASALRTTSFVPQLVNCVPKRTLLTKSFAWNNRMRPHHVTSLLGSQQGKKHI